MSEDLTQRLASLLQEMVGALGADATRHAVEAAVSDLGSAPTLEVAPLGPDHFQVIWTFDSSSSLRSVLPELLDIQAAQWEFSESSPLPMMAELTISLRSQGLEDLNIPGRVVHVQGSRVASQVFVGDLAERLRARPDAMDDARQSQVTPPRTTRRLASRELPEIPHELGATSSSALVQPSSPHEILNTKSWRLDGSDVTRPLTELSLERATGWLTLTRRGEEVRVALLRGSMVDIERRPLQSGDQLEMLLVKANKLTEAQASELHVHTRTYRCSMADALLDLGYLDHSTLRAALKTRLSYLLKHIWSDGFTRARFEEVARLHQLHSTPPLSLARLLFERIHKDLSSKQAQVTELREALLGHVLYIPEDFVALDLGISAKYVRFVDGVLRSPHYLEEFEVLSGMGKGDTAIFLLALHQMGVLVLEESNQETRARKAEFERLAQMCARALREDPFEVLGLHWSAFDSEIQECSQQLLAEHSLDEYTDRSEIQEMLTTIRAGVQAASEKVAKRRQRAEYRHSNVDPYMLQNSVDMFLRQAEGALMRHDLGDVVKFSKRVLELQPTHPKPFAFLKRVKEIEAKREARNTQS